MRVWLVVFCLLADVALAETLCCGRGAKPMGERSTVPLEKRESPWGADLVFGVEGDVEKAIPAVRGVAGVTHVEARARWMRVWGAKSVVANVSAAAGAVGVRLVPAHEVRVPIADAAEKGKLGRVGRMMAQAPGVIDLEIEAEGEQAVARLWMRPGALPPAPRSLALWQSL
jgi:hypothetical protein